MAEAHAAVAFSFAVTPEGVDVQVSQEAINAVFFSGVRSWRKRITRFFNRFSTGVYPAKFSSLTGLTLIAMLSEFIYGYDLTYGTSSYYEKILFKQNSIIATVTSNLLACLTLWLIFVIVVRHTLKVLLCYQGWMYDQRGKVSLVTKLWSLGVKVFGGRNPQLYSYQASLPRLPVPSINDTVKRYMLSVRPLLDDENYEEMNKLAEEFRTSVGPNLQWYLKLKSWWASNYVTDWWEEYVYLAGRSPIMVNSNYYGMDLLYYVPTTSQASRAASVIHYLFRFRSKLDKEQIKPIIMQGMIPLCSAQYERVFNTCRIPGVEKDTIEHFDDCRHVIVIHKGRYFKLICYKSGVLLKPCELEGAIKRIMQDTSEPKPGELHLAALTAGDRVPWAKAREKFFNSGVNQKSLHAIEKSAFIVVLDDESFQLSDTDTSSLSACGRSLLHGKCYDRWFDKSFNVVIYGNGRFGVNAEHSWADAPIMSYLVEHVLGAEFLNEPFDQDGNCKGTPRFHLHPFPPTRLNFELNEECQQVIESSLTTASNLANDLHLHVFPFKHFGKGLVKKFKMSPDAFIQAALQVAHLRDKGHFSLTYEASMTRLFREGRTETVRSCTNEMAAFAKSMNDDNANGEERLSLLRMAANRHTMMYKLAMTGHGIDRHLFCLYVVSKYKKIESPFLQKVLQTPWRLSTSQTPVDQAGVVRSLPNDHKFKNASGIGGGFGPVADDGYGVSYIICHEDMIMFHVSSKKSSPETDSERFAKNIEQAMLDMRDVCMKRK